MKTIQITGTQRSNISKQEVKELRASGKVPCVLYGGKEQIHFAVESFDFRGLIYTPEVHMVKLNVDGKEYQATLQDVQYHPVNDALRHVDFLEVSADKPITMSIPVKFTGTSEGVRAGGKLISKMRRMKVKALAADMPDFITVDISPMKIGSNVRVRDINVKGVTFLDTPNNVVVTVRVTRNVVEEEKPAAASAAPAAAPAAK